MHKKIKRIGAYTLLLSSLISISACNGGSGSSPNTSSVSPSTTSYLYSADSIGKINEYQVTPSAIKLVTTISDPDGLKNTVQIKHDSNHLYVIKQSVSSQNGNIKLSVYQASLHENGAIVDPFVLLQDIDLGYGAVNSTAGIDLPMVIIAKAGMNSLLVADNQNMKLLRVDLLGDRQVSQEIPFADLGLSNTDLIQEIVKPKFGSDLVQIRTKSTVQHGTGLAIYKIDLASIQSWFTLVTAVTTLEAGIIVDSRFKVKPGSITPEGRQYNDTIDTEYTLLTPTDGLKNISTFDGTAERIWADSSEIIHILNLVSIYDLIDFDTKVSANWLLASDYTKLEAIDMSGKALNSTILTGAIFDLVHDINEN